MSGDDIHPELRRIARFAPRRMAGPVLTPLLRRLSGLSAHRTPPRDVEVLTLESGTGVRLYRPAPEDGVSGEPAAALLWIHGGGYVAGAAQHDDRLCLGFSRRLGITVASVDYRLAPAHPYPASLQDCYSALTWLAGLPAVDRRRVAIGGASGGGGLAAALALLVRDRGELNPVFQLLVYPMLDDRSSLKADEPGYRIWNTRANRYSWAAYLGDADPWVAVPGRRDDLAGLAPAWIGVGTNDLFHDEDLAYAKRLVDAGVPCEVDVVPGAFHGFDIVAAKAQVSQQFYDRQCDVLRAALAPAPGHIAK